MKKIIRNEELYAKMQEAINLLCNTVKSTLGPKGSNAIIDHSHFTPFITNDGVTIAENVCSEDEIVNTMLELAKESSIKTNEKVGDGTTTTLVLLQSIFNKGLECLEKGINPILIKEELHKSLENILIKLASYKKIPSKEELKNIAIISSNDEEIGNIISDVYLKILNRSSIDIEESNEEKTSIFYYQGYVLNSDLASPYFLSSDNEIYLNDVKILLLNNHLEDISSLSNIINKLLKTKDNLLIVANSYNNYLVEEIININRENDLHIILLNNDIYADHRLEILKDLKAISKANIISNMDNIFYDDLGYLVSVTLNKDKTILNFKFNNDIKKRMLELNESLNNKEEKEFIQKRITMMEKGSAIIKVGGYTTTERREKKMRFIDALWAISEADKGVVLGGGMIYTTISDNLQAISLGDKILKYALLEPMKTILNNAGISYNEVYNKIKENNYQIIFNVKNNAYEEVINTMVLDPFSVIKEELINATSIASMLLTTTSLVINEYQNNLPKTYGLDEL